MHLQSARKFFEQDSVLDLVKHTTGKDIPEDSDANWINVALGGDSGVLGEEIDDGTEEYGVSRVRMATAAKNMWELESLVKALDALETIANLEQLFREYVDSFIHFLGEADKRLAITACRCLRSTLRSWVDK